MSGADAPGRAGARGPTLPVALAVGLVLADSSIVTLALPEILRELDTSVGSVAWVLIAFNLALAAAALPAARLTHEHARGAFAAGLIAFAAASLGCAAAGSLEVLVAARAAQGLAGAVAVAAALELLVARAGARPAIGRWAAAGVLGAAVGPAAGGILTEAFSWEAMFALQAPVALLALAGVRGGTRAGAAAGPGSASRSAEAATGRDAPSARFADAAGPPPASSEGLGAGRPALAPLAALTLLSAALAAALFLLVLMIIEGWRVSPGQAALAVSVMPVAALIAGRLVRGRESTAVAAAGAVLVAGGLAGLGLLPDADAAWTVGPQVAIGAGLGLALAALIGGTVGPALGAVDAEDRVGGPAAWTITARHVGIVLGLLALTPLFTSDLESAQGPAERAGVARLLDAPLPLEPKIDLARALAEQVEQADDELPDLGPAFERAGRGESPAARAQLRTALEEELDRAGTDAFSRSFLAASGFALLALVPLWLARRRRMPSAGAQETNGSPLAAGAPLAVAVPAAAALATLLLAVLVAAGGGGYGPSEVANPCAARERSDPERLGRTQLIALAVLDGAACELQTSREQLLLDLLRDEPPGGADGERLTDALRNGLNRAREEGQLGIVESAVLKSALGDRGADAVLELLLDR